MELPITCKSGHQHYTRESMAQCENYGFKFCVSAGDEKMAQRKGIDLYTWFHKAQPVNMYIRTKDQGESIGLHFWEVTFA